MKYTKSLCFDKLDLIEGMIKHCLLNDEEIKEIWEKLNGVSHEIDEYIDRNGVRDRKAAVEPNPSEVPMSIVTSSHGTFIIESETGCVIDSDLDDCEDCPEYETISKFDIEEWCKYWKREPEERYYDILDLGYWYGDGKYEKPENDWRKEFGAEGNRGPVEVI